MGEKNDQSIIGKGLDALMSDEVITPRQMAEDVLGVSYQHFMQQKKGIRKVNSELIFKIAYKRGLSPGKVGSYFVMKDTEKKDEHGKRRVTVLVLNYARGDKAGTISFIDEAFLREIYTDYEPINFYQYIEKYLGDKFYNAEYEKYLKNMEQEKEIANALGTEVLQRGVLREIAENIYKLNEKNLECIRDIVNAYLKHHRLEEKNDEV